MTNLLTRCVLNRTLVMSVVSVSKHETIRQFKLIDSGIIFRRGNSRLAFRGPIYGCKHRAFSTTNKNRVKLFQEKENAYAHFVMESNPAYSQTLCKRNVLKCKSLSHDDYIQYCRKDWSRSSASELLSAFTRITDYCATHSKTMAEPELNNICKFIAEKSVAFNDNELIAFVECLIHWPQTESLNSVNFVDVWNSLDRACLERVKAWDVGTLLYVADVWYCIHLSRVSRYVSECIWRLGRKIKHLSPQELVQCMFYMNSSRKFKVSTSMYEFEFYIEQYVQHLSIDELSIVAMGFFKSETKIHSPRILSCMIHKTMETVNSINEISLCSLMKLFRYCLPLTLVDEMCQLLDKTVPNISRLSQFCCIQIALVGTSVQLFHKQIIMTIAQRFINELPTSRLKDIERMIFVMTLYDFIPECTPDFFEKTLTEIQNNGREKEISQYPKNLAYCLNYLSLRGMYPAELLDKVLSQKFIEETYDRKNLYALGRELLCLDVGVELECPEYRGSRLNCKARRFLAKRFTRFVPNRTKKNLSSSERLFMDILEATEAVIGRENVYADVISPNYTLPDIVVAVDASGRGVPIAGLFSRYNIEDVKHPPRGLDPHRWICLVAGNMNMFIRDVNVPLGTTKAKLRHLSIIGYHPVLVPWFEFTNLTAHDKRDYVSKKILITS